MRFGQAATGNSIAGKKRRFSASIFNGPGSGLASFRIASKYGYFGACGSKAVRNCTPEGTGGTDDDGCFSSEIK
jgi:hypothetical protein